MIKAIVVDKVNGILQATHQKLSESDLPDEDVLVDIACSSLNYKDGLALTGGPICRRTPMSGLIDMAADIIAGRVRGRIVVDVNR